MSARDWAAVYLKGAAMGAADAVPGVSGGTIALITGIYERLVGAIASLDPAEVFVVLELLPHLTSADGRAEFAATLRELEVPFLVVLAVGVFSAVLTVANLVEIARHEHTAVTFAFFLGLIAASVVVLLSEVSLDTPGRVTAGVVGFALAFVLSGLGQGSLLSASLPLVFVAGAVAICAMVLPGVSGSLLLLTFGLYATMTSAVSEATGAALSGEFGAAAEPASTLAVFSVGALLGVLTFARAVEWAFEHYRAATLTFLVALMAGALRAPAIRIGKATSTWTVETVAPVLVAALVGAGLVLVLDATTDDLDY